MKELLSEKKFFDCQEYLTAFNEKSRALILSLIKYDMLVAKRSVLSNSHINSNNNFGFKTLVWLELGFNVLSFDKNNHFYGLKGLWLIEEANGQILFLGCRKKANYVGGTPLHELNIFNENAMSVNELIDRLVEVCMRSEQFQWYFKSQLSKLFSPADIYQILFKLEQVRVAKAIHFFKNSIDSRIVPLIDGEELDNVAQYNFFISNNPTIKRNRIQAAESYPFLATKYMQNYHLKQCIDRGNQLQKAIMQQYGISKGVLKYLKTYARYFDKQFLNYNNVHHLGCFTMEQLPKTETDIKVYCQLSPQLITLASYLEISPQQLAAPFNKGWHEGLRSIENELEIPVDISMIFKLFDDMYLTLLEPLQMKIYNRLVIPKSHKWYADWYKNETLIDLLRTAKCWFKFYLEIQKSKYNNILCYQQLYCWPVLLTPTQLSSFDLPWGYYIVELSSEFSLINEGEELDHCVSEYFVNCLLGSSYIYSLRNERGESQTTFELKFLSTRFELIQHSALENDEPSDFEEKIVSLFVDYLNEVVDEKMIEKNHYEKHKNVLSIRSLIKKLSVIETIIKYLPRKSIVEMLSKFYPKQSEEQDVINYLKLLDSLN